jgi:hypothetical protein
LKKGEAFLRLTFQPLTPPALPTKPVVFKRSDYVEEVQKKFARRLGETFMDFEKLSAAATRKFIAGVQPLAPFAAIVGVGLALLTLAMNWGVLALASRSMPQDVVQAKAQVLTMEIKQDNQKLHDENEKLQQQLKEIRAQLDRLSNKK